jgi:hypothetical protein
MTHDLQENPAVLMEARRQQIEYDVQNARRKPEQQQNKTVKQKFYMKIKLKTFEDQQVLR